MIICDSPLSIVFFWAGEWVENGGTRVINEPYITTNNDLQFRLEYIHVQFPTKSWYLVLYMEFIGAYRKKQRRNLRQAIA